MAFVPRTRLVQYADLVGGTQTVLGTPVVVQTWTGVVRTYADAVALLPAGQRPPPADAWKYLLEWEVQSSTVPTVRGVALDHPPNQSRLVFDVAFWDTPAARTAAPTAPQRQNTFQHDFSAGRLAAAAPEVRASIDAYLLNAEIKGYPADDRDTRVVATTDPAFDPVAVLTRPAIVAMNGQPVDLAPTWRRA